MPKHRIADDLIKSFNAIYAEEYIAGRIYSGIIEDDISYVKNSFLTLLISNSNNTFRLSRDMLDFIFSDFLSQQNRDEVTCWDASAEMLENGGAEPLKGKANGIETGTESGASDDYTVNASKQTNKGQNYLDSQINQRNPVLVGVDYAFGKNRNGGTTDHFVAISSRTINLQTGNKSYNFFEPGTQWKAKGIHSTNVFNLNSKGLLQGTTNYSGKTYTVTHVRKNN